MALNVQNFRSQLKGDGARPTLFRVKVAAPAWVGFPSEKMTFMATATRLPSATLGTNIVPFMGQDVKFAGDRTYPDWDVTIINDEDFAIRNAFERWNNGMSQYTRNDGVRVDGATSNPNSYIGTVVVEHLGKEGDVIKTYTLMNAWPNNISPINLSWAAKDSIENFYVVFSFDYFVSSDATN